MYIKFYNNLQEQERWKSTPVFIRQSDKTFIVNLLDEPTAIRLTYDNGNILFATFTYTVTDGMYIITITSEIYCGRFYYTIISNENTIFSDWLETFNETFVETYNVKDLVHLPITFVKNKVKPKTNSPVYFDLGCLPNTFFYVELPTGDTMFDNIEFKVEGVVNANLTNDVTINDINSRTKIIIFDGKEGAYARGLYRYVARVYYHSPLEDDTTYYNLNSNWFCLTDCDKELELMTFTLRNENNLGNILLNDFEFKFKIPCYLSEIEIETKEEANYDSYKFAVPSYKRCTNRYIFKTALCDNEIIDLLHTLSFWDSVILETYTKTIHDITDIVITAEYPFVDKKKAQMTINAIARLSYKNILPPALPIVTFNVTDKNGAVADATITVFKNDVTTLSLATNENGILNCELANGYYTFWVDKQKYYQYTGSFTVDGDTIVNITLVKQKGKYTETELNTMILLGGYVPVASLAELKKVQLSTSVPILQEMGKGTKYEGIYNVNIFHNLKMVQVEDFAETEDLFTPMNTIQGSNIIYDGNELDMYINMQEVSYVGMFRILYAGSIVRNVRGVFTSKNISNAQGGGCASIASQNNGLIENCIVEVDIINHGVGSGGIAVTSLAGSKISNCHVKGSIEFTNGYPYNANPCGGLVGTNSGEIEKSSAIVNIEKYKQYVGGLVGRCDGGTIKECFAKAMITDLSNTGYMGGLVGNAVNSALIENCYAMSELISDGYGLGGLIGTMAAATINNCYSASIITSVSLYAYALVGVGTIGSVVSNCYADITIAGKPIGSFGTGKTTSEMQQGAINDIYIYINWLTSIWDSMDSDEYPQLKNNYETDSI